MSKSYYTDLEDFIQMMTGPEKRHFLVYASRHSPPDRSTYMQVYFMLSSKRKYTHEEIQKRIGQTQNGYSQIRRYLFRLLLKSVNIYHAGTERESEIKEILAFARLLHQRGMFTAHDRMIARCRELTETGKNALQALEVHDQAFRGIESALENYATLPDEQVVELFKKGSEKLAQVRENHRYKEFQIRINLMMLRVGAVRSAEQQAGYDQIVAAPILKKKPESIPALLSYHETWGIYHFVVRNFSEAYLHHREACDIYENESLWRRENAQDWITSLGNAVHCGLLAGKEKAVYPLLRLLGKVYRGERVARQELSETGSRAFTYYSLLSLRQFIALNQLQEALQFIPEIMKGSRKLPALLGRRHMLAIHFHIAIIYYRLADYPNAEKYLRLVRKNEFLHLSAQMRLASTAFHVVLLYDWRKYRKLEQAIDEGESILRDVGWPCEIEKTVFQFLRSAGADDLSTHDLKFKFRQLYEELSQICRDPNQCRPLDFFDYLSWAGSNAR